MIKEELKNELIKILDALNDFETSDDKIDEKRKQAIKNNYNLLKELLQKGGKYVKRW